MRPCLPLLRSDVRFPVVPLLTLVLLAPAAHGGDLTRGVRGKISAGDLASGEAAVEEYRRTKGVDAEYLDAVGWLARGAEMLGRRDRAAAFVAEVRREIPVEKREKDDLIIPFGAAVEVEAKLRLASEGRGSAIRFLEGELLASKEVSLRSRIRKNLNLLGLEGQKAPELGTADALGGKQVRLADFAGKPVLMFFWAAGCGDCKADAPKMERLVSKYAPKGLVAVAPTRLYGTGADHKDATPAEERAFLTKVWAETYAGLAAVPVPIDTETMVRYGVSATPTMVLVDRKGTVRLYAPTRMTEAELARRIEALLAEGT